jgi:F-type H+-transporting ATPase subunit delta
MKGNTLFLAGRYAKAYDSLAKDNGEAKVNFEEYKNALAALNVAAVYIINPTVSFEVKAEVLAKILPRGKAASFIKLLIFQKRFYLADIIGRELQTLLDKRLGTQRVSVVTAVSFGNSEKEKINIALSRYFNSRISVEYKEDSTLLAGLTIRRGDTFIDGSAQGRIKQLTKKLVEK